MSNTHAVWSGIGRLGRGVRLAALAGVAVACGRTSTNDSVNSEPGSSSGGAGGPATGHGGTARPRAGAPHAAGVAGDGASGAISMGAGGSTAGGSPALAPEESEGWTWKACGSVPALEAQPVGVAHGASPGELVVLYDDGRIVVHGDGGSAADRVLRQPGGTIPTQFAVSIGGEYLAEAAVTTVQVRRFDGSLVLPPLNLQGCPTASIRFSFEGERLLTWDEQAICVWRVRDGSLLHRVPGEFTSAALNGNRLLAAGSGAAPTLTSFQLPALTRTSIPLELSPDVTETWNLVVSPRGDTVASQFGPFSSTQQGSGLWSSEGSLLAYHTLFGSSYSPDGSLIMMGADLLDSATGTRLQRIPEELSTLAGRTALDASGTRVAHIDDWTNRLSFAVLHDALTGDRLQIYGPTNPGGALRDLAISGDGTRLAVSFDAALLWSIAPEFAASQRIAGVSVWPTYDVDFSPASELLVSGGGWSMFSAEGTRSIETAIPPPESTGNCLLMIPRVSPGNRWLAVGELTPHIRVRERGSMQDIVILGTRQCNARAAFSADEEFMATTGPALYRTRDWSRVWGSLPEVPNELQADLYQDVAFMPGGAELLVSNCRMQGTTPSCDYVLHSLMDGFSRRALPQLTAHRASISAEGHWVVSGSTVLHVPTNTVHALDPSAALALFTPDGDVIGAGNDGSLTRYCRTTIERKMQ